MSQALRPTVFIGAIPRLDWSVTRFDAEAPLDRRVATLSRSVAAKRDDTPLPPGEITLAIPHALADGEVRWQVLLAGESMDEQANRSSGLDRDLMMVKDRLAAILDEPTSTIEGWPSEGLSLEALLQRVCALIDAECVAAVDSETRSLCVTPDATRSMTIGSRLRSATSAFGLAIEQTLVFEGGRARRTLTLIAGDDGRHVSLPWPDAQGRGGRVISVAVDREAKPPRRWVARGDRPVVEDTFALQPGWDPGLEGRPDSDYDRLTSTDFSRFAGVYRNWVLNEDGAYREPPFDLDAFDAGALFGRPGSIDRALRLGPCLTRSDARRALPPVIESSTDGGASWSAYPGAAEVSTDRAGVLLADDALPSGILAAAKAGTLRIRVTASLPSPLPIETQRWDGNPFAGPAPTRILDLGDRFAWRRVVPGSLHADAIAGGTLTADTADDRLALASELRDAIAGSPGGSARATLQLHGSWTALRPGDRVREALGANLGIDGSPSRFDGPIARIQGVRIGFGVSDDAPRTRLILEQSRDR
ncbi:MAG: hypothetical protein ACPGYV_01810 [Phycisphaeraceae bacterium]